METRVCFKYFDHDCRYKLKSHAKILCLFSFRAKFDSDLFKFGYVFFFRKGYAHQILAAELATDTN